MSPLTMLKRIQQQLGTDHPNQGVNLNSLTPNEISILQACIIACSIKDSE